MRLNNVCRKVAAACLMAVPAAAAEQLDREVVAAEVPSLETGSEADHLTGGWGGFRDRLVDRGIHLSAGYSGDVMGNVSGGLRRGAVYLGLLELGLTLETDPLGWWRNGTFHFSSIAPHGRSPTEHLVGDLHAVSNIDAHESFRLYEAWYEHQFFDGRFSLRLGQLTADDEYTLTGPGGNFLNAGFGWPAFVSANTINGGPAYFAAAPGVRARVEAGGWHFQAGLYDGDSLDSPEGDPRRYESGTRFGLSREQGAFMIGETGMKWNENETKRLPGAASVGAWLHTGEFESFTRDREASRNYGFYAAAEQALWRDPASEGRAVYGFARAGASPRDRSPLELTADAGFTFHGLCPRREDDVTGMGFLYARVSRDLRRVAREERAADPLAHAAVPDHEIVVEVFHQFHVRPWLMIQPDFQWVHHPGGSAALDDAFVVGLRTTLVF